ncbi:MAG: serine hydrolase domain-containing protein [Chitinophagaceae bacterium]
MRICLLVLSLFALQHSYAQQWQDTVLQLRSIISRYYDSSGPGGQFSVMRNGRVVYDTAWGIADLEHGVPMKLDSRIEAGSVSKQFTAGAILLLEQQGKLSVEDDVRKYVPELPDYGRVIRIRHLLDHSSGLRDWGSVAVISGWPRSTKFYTNDDALDLLKRQQQLNYVPGAEFIYSNSNYNLMAIIVQRVSGVSLAEYTRKYIFEPAGMKRTQWRDNPNRVVPDRAIGYSRNGATWETDMPNEFVYGNGGLLTTVEDLQIWTKYCLDGKFGSPSLRTKQLKTYAFNNGAMNEYGAGLFIQPVNGKPAIQHSGATAGYRSWLVYYPELNLSIAMLFNTPRNYGEAPRAFFNVFAPEKPTTPAAAVAADSTLFKKMVGWYKNNRDGSGILIGYANGRATADGFNVPLLTPNTFVYQGERFMLDVGHGVRKVVPGKDTVMYSKVELSPEKMVLQEFIGTYYSAETVSTAVMNERNGQLVLQLKPNMEYILFPTYKDGFRSPSLGSLFVARDKRGRVTGFTLSVSRARNIAFSKTN